jgi:cbb3-type cytochrome oxidase subunit 3
MEHRATDVQTDRESSPRGKRFWLMAIGCGLPLVALVVLPAMGVAWGTILFFIVLLLCPLMHLFGMHGSHHQPNSKRSHGPHKEER